MFRTVLLQRAFLRLMPRQRFMNAYVANVPGPPIPLYFAGAPVLEIFPVVPFTGNLSIGVGALSCAGQFNLAVVADRDLCPDLDVCSPAECGVLLRRLNAGLPPQRPSRERPFLDAFREAAHLRMARLIFDRRHPPSLRRAALSAACRSPPGCSSLVARGGTQWSRKSMADHYTLWLAPGVRQRLSEWARRAGLQERTLAQRYVEEGLRHDAHPLIQFLDGPSGRRASLLGRGLDVWEVIATIRDNNGSIAEAAGYLQIPAGLVEAAVAYYGEYRDEIDRDIELNEAAYERGRAAAAAGEQALRS
jgi:WS/DGAT C-terminal domain